MNANLSFLSHYDLDVLPTSFSLIELRCIGVGEGEDGVRATGIAHIAKGRSTCIRVEEEEAGRATGIARLAQDGSTCQFEVPKDYIITSDSRRFQGSMSTCWKTL